MINGYKIIIGKSVGKRQVRKLRRRWQDIINVNSIQIRATSYGVYSTGARVSTLM